jgi:hypothetical protein|nr:MAG TPA: hypothetical protein [Caudoviricetes sp.]
MREVDYKTGYNLRDMHNGRIDSRTSIEKEGNWFVVRLHGNEIARYDGKTLEIDSCGYYTLTTTNRLNGILNAITGGFIKRKGGKFYLNDEEWDGRAVKVN